MNMFYLALKYKTCIASTKKRCKSETLDMDVGVDVKRCKEMCSQNTQCNFITYIHGNQKNVCLLFEFCDEFESIADTGTIFSQNACPGKINYLKFL